MLPKITAEGNKAGFFNWLYMWYQYRFSRTSTRFLPLKNAVWKEYETMPIIPRIEQQLYPQYYIEMYSPTTWECVPNSRIEMDPHEHILSQKTVFLKSEASLSGRSLFVIFFWKKSQAENNTSRLEHRTFVARTIKGTWFLVRGSSERKKAIL